MFSPSMASSSYWCYRCNRVVRVWPRDAIACPDCGGGFLEEAASPPRRHRRAAAGDRYPFNPVIVLRGPTDAPAATFELYYYDRAGAGAGLRPLPASMSDFLMTSGFDRLLDQLTQLEITGLGGAGNLRGCERPPASKAAIDSMPTVEIAPRHVSLDSHCAVCKEAFELGDEAREMPCKHIYHQDCILPWLALRNSCPVCRHELQTDQNLSFESDGGVGGEEETVGLTIWRLPGGGFAVGRFSGGRRAGERELPVVYTEMDGGFNSGGTPRRISWASRGSQARESGGIGRAIRSFFSLFRRSHSSRRRSSESGSSSSSSRISRRDPVVISRMHRNGWAVEDRSPDHGTARW